MWSTSKIPTDAPFATLPSWEQALISRDPKQLLALNAYDLTHFPTLAPAFADLKRQLRFADDGEQAKAAYIYEVLVRLRANGAIVATGHCNRIIKQLEHEYARRHTVNGVPA